MRSLGTYCMSLILNWNPIRTLLTFVRRLRNLCMWVISVFPGAPIWPNYDLPTYVRRLRTPTLLSHCSPTPDDVHNTSIKVRSTLSSQFCLHSEPPDQSTQHFVKSLFLYSWWCSQRMNQSTQHFDKSFVASNICANVRNTLWSHFWIAHGDANNAWANVHHTFSNPLLLTLRTIPLQYATLC